MILQNTNNYGDNKNYTNIISIHIPHTTVYYKPSNIVDKNNNHQTKIKEMCSIDKNREYL